MLLYALKVVPPEWDEQMPIPFTQAEHDQWRDQIQTGTRVLIFKGAPVNQLVAEGEVHGFFVQPHRWSAATATDGLLLPIAGAGRSICCRSAMLYIRPITPESRSLAQPCPQRAGRSPVPALPRRMATARF